MTLPRPLHPLLACTILLLPLLAWADPPPASSSSPEAVGATDGTGEASEERSEARPPSALDRRRADEDRIRGSAFAITPHRQNYCLLVSYDPDPNSSTYEFASVNEPKHVEAKFQLSFKILAWKNLLGKRSDLYFGYTQLSLWQVYDKALSSPFRETNYEPEIFFKFDTDFDVLGLRARIVTFGLNHESNGQVEPFSRSWNRVFATLVAERGNLVVALKPWWRIPESDEEDDNPEIGRYLGYGELYGAYRWREHVFSFLVRNNLWTSDNRGAVELGWSFPLLENTRGYVQFFNGHGESLIDHDDSATRIGAGVMLFDWL
jgi:phospholipase A1